MVQLVQFVQLDHLIDVAQRGIHGADVHVAHAEVLGGDVGVQAAGDNDSLQCVQEGSKKSAQ